MHIFSNDKDRLVYLKSKISVLPEMPGVYQYFDSTGKIIYIGKAKNLKKRVSSYFISRKNHTSKTNALVEKIYDIKHIVVNSESDAFFLENNLIKKYQPHYNILLKDGKTYPWIVIKSEPFPRVFLTRNIVRDGSVYYGPYSSSFKARTILDMFSNIYPLRTCSMDVVKSRDSKNNKPCLKYHIKKCCAPCIGEVDESTYNTYIDDIRDILRGKTNNVIRMYRKKMADAAEALEFELANDYKNIVDILSNYQSRSNVSVSSSLNVDVFSYLSSSVEDTDITKANKTCFVNYLKVVDGSMINSFTMEFKIKLDETPEEILSYAIEEVRTTAGVLSREVVVPFLPDVEFENVKFTVPQLGDKKSLLELSEKNAMMYRLEKAKEQSIKNQDTKEERLLQTIKECLNLTKVPHHIECFDNSNIQGTSAVAGCVVYRDCKPSKDEYRRFNIKTVEGPDDYASMYEVVYRRYSRLVAENKELPDLIIADGGIGQMEVIRKATEEALGLNIPIMGLVKDNKHRTRELLIGFPPKTIGIGKNDQIFKFFTRVQDEVHRYAIAFHREKRSSLMLNSSLDNIPGIGPKTKELLLNDYKSVANIEKLSVDELAKTIGKSKAGIVYNYFHRE